VSVPVPVPVFVFVFMFMFMFMFVSAFVFAHYRNVFIEIIKLGENGLGEGRYEALTLAPGRYLFSGRHISISTLMCAIKLE
jgi:hypothetical protein